MPAVLIISLYGKSFFTGDKYKQLLAVLLSRTTVHEALTISDATAYIACGWPSIILVTDPVLTHERYADFMCDLVKWIHGGGTAILMGRFAPDVEWPDLNALLQLLQKDSVKPWSMIAYSKEIVKIHRNVTGMRTNELPETANVRALFLKNVRNEEILYYHKASDRRICSAAYANIGFGWFGFIGSFEIDETVEKTIISMCRLDQHNFDREFSCAERARERKKGKRSVE